MRKLKPGVSVVIPTYNMADTFMTAVKSALPQANQVIVVDDGSTDHTGEIRHGLGIIGVDKGIIDYVRHDLNRGIGAALNSGLALVEHEWFFPMGADDTLEEGCLDELRNVGELTEADVVTPTLAMSPTHIMTPPRVSRRGLAHGPGTWAMSLVRTQTLLSIGGYDPHMPHRTCEDWELWCRLFTHGAKFSSAPGARYNYTMKDGRVYEKLDVRAEVVAYLSERYPNIFGG